MVSLLRDFGTFTRKLQYSMGTRKNRAEIILYFCMFEQHHLYQHEKSIISQHLLVQILQWTHQNIVSNLLIVNKNDTGKTLLTSF